ncbi:hypothetical protein MNEG_15983, partial [Monoraphidium neglectum]
MPAATRSAPTSPERPPLAGAGAQARPGAAVADGTHTGARGDGAAAAALGERAESDPGRPSAGEQAPARAASRLSAVGWPAGGSASEGGAAGAGAAPEDEERHGAAQGLAVNRSSPTPADAPATSNSEVAGAAPAGAAAAAPVRRAASADSGAAGAAGAWHQKREVLARIETELQEVLTASGRRAAPYVPVRGSA